MLAEQALREAVDAVDKHLPGKHYQQTHAGNSSAVAEAEEDIKYLESGIEGKLAKTLNIEIIGEQKIYELTKLTRFGPFNRIIYDLGTGKSYINQGRLSHFEMWNALDIPQDRTVRLWVNANGTMEGSVYEAGIEVGGMYDVDGIDKAMRNLDKAYAALVDLGMPPYTDIIQNVGGKKIDTTLKSMMEKHLAGRHDQKRHAGVVPVLPNLIEKVWQGTHISSNVASLKEGFESRDLGVSIARLPDEENSVPTIQDQDGETARVYVTVTGRGLDYGISEHKKFIDRLIDDELKQVRQGKKKEATIFPILRALGVDWVNGMLGSWGGSSPELHVINQSKIHIDKIVPVQISNDSWGRRSFVEKHLAGRHDQKRHGRLGSVQDSLPDFSRALEPNTLPSGTVVTGLNGMKGRATGRSVKGVMQVNRAIANLKKAYPDEDYFAYSMKGRWNIIQVGEGPIRSTISHIKTKPVVPPAQPSGSDSEIRSYLVSLGVSKRRANYGEDADRMITSGEKIVSDALSRVTVNVDKNHPSTEDTMIALGMIGPAGAKLTLPQSTTSNFYKLTVKEALAMKDHVGVESGYIQNEILRGIDNAAMPSQYRYWNNIPYEHRSVEYLDLRNAIAQSMYGASLNDASDWLDRNLLTDERAPNLRMRDEGFRAQATEKLGLEISPTDRGEVLVHERGHWLEYDDNAVGAASDEFVKSRATNRRLIKLKTLTGSSYNKWEKALKDTFIDPYVGKRYDNANRSEVVSMGLAAMYSRSLTFLTQDPDHYFLTLAAMYGKKYRPW